jgi:hypothetical protein
MPVLQTEVQEQIKPFVKNRHFLLRPSFHLLLSGTIQIQSTILLSGTIEIRDTIEIPGTILVSVTIEISDSVQVPGKIQVPGSIVFQATPGTILLADTKGIPTGNAGRHRIDLVVVVRGRRVSERTSSDRVAGARQDTVAATQAAIVQARRVGRRLWGFRHEEYQATPAGETTRGTTDSTSTSSNVGPFGRTQGRFPGEAFLSQGTKKGATTGQKHRTKPESKPQ